MTKQMGDQFYYVDKQLRKLEGKEKQELQKKIDEIDWSILDAVERRETITERGVFAPLDAVEVDEIAARADEFKKTGLKRSAPERSGRCFWQEARAQDWAMISQKERSISGSSMISTFLSV